MTTPQTPPASAGLSRGTLYAMALASGLGVANIYYNQPMLGVMSREMSDPRVGSLIPTLTQLGYAGGLLFLLPLGDMLERRRLIVTQFLVLALALCLAALAPGLTALALASVLVGAAATVAQQIVPYAAILAPPHQRGAAIGTVMSGLLTGILLSRTLAGMVSGVAGWRAMFWLAVPITVLSAILMQRTLPRHPPTGQLAYRPLMVSLYHLWRREPVLRRSAVTQALLFGSFSVFWTLLALRLEQPPLHLGAAAAGLFGIVGAVGVGMAPVAGRIADRRGPAPVITLGVLATLLSWLVLGCCPGLTGLVLGVILLDFGVQIAMVSHQHRVYGLHPAYKSRLNTLYMTTMFLGGAAGSALAALVWRQAAWHGAAILGGALALAAGFNHLRPEAARSPDGAH